MKRISQHTELPNGIRLILIGEREFTSFMKRYLYLNRPDISIPYIIQREGDPRQEACRRQLETELKLVHYDVDLIMICDGIWSSIEEICRDLDIKDCVAAGDIFWHYFFDISPEIVNKFNQVKRLLKEKEDVELFNKIIDARSYSERILSDYFVAAGYDTRRQYMDYINRDAIKVVIEGGSLNGFTSLMYSQHFPNIRKSYAMEPFLEAMTEGPYGKQIAASSIIEPVQACIWSCKDKLTFKKDAVDPMQSQGASAIADLHGMFVDPNNEQFVTVDAISIDELVHDKKINKVDFIQFDLEAAEMEALKGAIHTIKNHRPQMALSLYHRKEHLYEIPLFVDELVDDYVYRLGHYTNHTGTTFSPLWESTLYAIPKEVYREPAPISEIAKTCVV